MEREKSGRDLAPRSRYNGDRQPMGELDRVGPGLSVEIVDEKSSLRVRLK